MWQQQQQHPVQGRRISADAPCAFVWSGRCFSLLKVTNRPRNLADDGKLHTPGACKNCVNEPESETRLWRETVRTRNVPTNVRTQRRLASEQE